MRLVLCDDHLLFLEPLASALAAHGHDVVTATTPSAAVEAVGRHDPDVCVLDMHFPAGTGRDAGRIIRERYPRTRVLMLSASTDPADTTSAVEAGAAGFVRKDQAVSSILAAIERVARGETVLDGAPKAGVPRRRSVRDQETIRLLRYLTPREREVLRRLVSAEDTRQIARSLNIAPSTARTHVQNVLVKLGVNSRLQAVACVGNADLGGDF